MEDELITVMWVWTAAASSASWTPDADYFVRYISSGPTVAVGYVSATFASIISPSQMRRDLLFLANATAANAAPSQHVINRTIYAGETLYVCWGAVVGMLTLFLQPIVKPT